VLAVGRPHHLTSINIVQQHQQQLQQLQAAIAIQIMTDVSAADVTSAT